MRDSDPIHATSFAIRPVIDAQAYEELLEEIRQAIGSPIDVTVTDFEPPAAGMSEIAATISFLADSKEVILPIVSWMAGRFGAPAFKTLRRFLNESRNSKDSGRPYIPLCIVFGTNPDNPGSVRFYFHGRPDERQLQRQYEEMFRVIDALPEEALAYIAGPPEYGFFWDEDQSRWRGQLYYSGNDADPQGFWLPPNLLDPVPGYTAPASEEDKPSEH